MMMMMMMMITTTPNHFKLPGNACLSANNTSHIMDETNMANKRCLLVYGHSHGFFIKIWPTILVHPSGALVTSNPVSLTLVYQMCRLCNRPSTE